MFLLCVAVNQPKALENIPKWKAELRSVEQEVPIILVTTKKDLRDVLGKDASISNEKMKKAKKEFGLMGLHDTSSKVWQDFNVHKAFNKSIKAALKFKYEDDDEDEDDDE